MSFKEFTNCQMSVGIQHTLKKANVVCRGANINEKSDLFEKTRRLKPQKTLQDLDRDLEIKRKTLRELEREVIEHSSAHCVHVCNIMC